MFSYSATPLLRQAQHKFRSIIPKSERLCNNHQYSAEFSVSVATSFNSWYEVSAFITETYKPFLPKSEFADKIGTGRNLMNILTSLKASSYKKLSLQVTSAP
jgi:hypothetical protein